ASTAAASSKKKAAAKSTAFTPSAASRPNHEYSGRRATGGRFASGRICYHGGSSGALERTLTTARAILFTLAMLLSVPLAAQGCDAAGFFGGAFKPATDRKDAGTLSASLELEPPDWMDFTGSGSARARGRFEFTRDGLVIKPDSDHGTCEALLDVGVSR